MRVVAVVLIACQLTTACTTWRLETLSPSDVITQRQPDVVRVDRADGRREVWYGPAIHGDSLVGWWDTSRKQRDRALPLTDIRQVSTSHTSASKTALVLLPVAALVAIGIGLSRMQGPLDNWGQ